MVNKKTLNYGQTENKILEPIENVDLLCGQTGRLKCHRSYSCQGIQSDGEIDFKILKSANKFHLDENK